MAASSALSWGASQSSHMMKGGRSRQGRRSSELARRQTMEMRSESEPRTRPQLIRHRTVAESDIVSPVVVSLDESTFPVPVTEPEIIATEVFVVSFIFSISHIIGPSLEPTSFLQSLL